MLPAVPGLSLMYCAKFNKVVLSCLVLYEDCSHGWEILPIQPCAPTRRREKQAPVTLREEREGQGRQNSLMLKKTLTVKGNADLAQKLLARPVIQEHWNSGACPYLNAADHLRSLLLKPRIPRAERHFLNKPVSKANSLTQFLFPENELF